MDAVNYRRLISGLLTICFFSLCVYFSQKAGQGPWHAIAVELWEKEDWHKLRSLGENLHQVGKQDVESFYIAMLASEQVQDTQKVQFFASLLSDSRVLNWKIERHIAKVYRPESLRQTIALFRTRAVFGIAIALLVLLMVSFRRKEPLQIAPAALSAAGILFFCL